MNNQGGPLCKGFAALVARIFPFSGVSDIVSPQQSLTGKTLAAHCAGVWFFAGMRPVVDFEALRSLQLLAT